MDIGKLLLFGGIGYIAYEYFLAPATATVSTAAGGIQPGTTPAVQQQPVAQAMTTQSLVQQAAAKVGMTMGTVDQWDALYQSTRGIAAPAPEDWGFTADNRAEQLTFAEWWGVASLHGLSGYRRAGMSDQSVLWGD